MLKKCLRNRGLISASRFLLGFFVFYILNGIEKVRGPTPLISTPSKSAFRPIKSRVSCVSRFRKPRAEKDEKSNAKQGGKCLKSAYTNRPSNGRAESGERAEKKFSSGVMGQEYTTFPAPSPESARRTPQNAPQTSAVDSASASLNALVGQISGLLDDAAACRASVEPFRVLEGAVADAVPPSISPPVPRCRATSATCDHGADESELRDGRTGRTRRATTARTDGDFGESRPMKSRRPKKVYHTPAPRADEPPLIPLARRAGIFASRKKSLPRPPPPRTGGRLEKI